MGIMKRLLAALFVISLPSSAQAITWGEFWDPFTGDNHHHHYRHEYHYSPRRYCDRKIYHEEYVPGNRWRPGYVRTWSEWVRVPCYELE
jgi:hypothetical protein